MLKEKQAKTKRVKPGQQKRNDMTAHSDERATSLSQLLGEYRQFQLIAGPNPTPEKLQSR